MFVGHYGVSLAAKRWTPGVSLGWLFLAVQALDVLFTIFVLAGVEKLRIVPGFTAYNPYDLYFMPYTHGLVGALFWSASAAVLTGILLRDDKRVAFTACLIGLCVLSHWLLDLPMHTADMPLLGNDSPKVGLGLWRHRELSLGAEFVVLAAGAWIWLQGDGARTRARVATTVFLVFLAVVLATTPFSPPPASSTAFAITALIAYVTLALVAALVDRRRGGAARRGHLLHPSNAKDHAAPR